MSITLNNSDFQCLQDQLVDLKTKNYDLTEKSRRSQADFEAAKAKILSLQLKLEEQERDFQVTSSCLRKEIETAYNCDKQDKDNNKENEESYKVKYKKLLHKAKELQQRYDKSLEVVQQMDSEIKALNGRVQNLNDENAILRKDLDDKEKLLTTQDLEYERKLNAASDDYKSNVEVKNDDLFSQIKLLTKNCDQYKNECHNLQETNKHINQQLEIYTEEKKIQDKKGLQIVKELKRQLTLEKNKSELIQKRLEDLLSSSAASSHKSPQDQLGSKSKKSTTASSSSTNSATTNGNGSWSMVQANNSVEMVSKSNLSICSIDLSDDRETVQHSSKNTSLSNEETKSESNSNRLLSADPQADSIGNGLDNISTSTSLTSLPSPHKISTPLKGQVRRDSSQTHFSDQNSQEMIATQSVMPLDEQIALMERVTKLQHDKWTLEEKLSYLEQANLVLSEELANKSDMIKHYFMNQAVKTHHSNSNNDNQHTEIPPFMVGNTNSRRISFPGHLNQLLSDKSSLKKVVDFLKERSQQVASSGESESISREATKKMQVMLEETLIKCIKLQENLDFVTNELNRLKS